MRRKADNRQQKVCQGVKKKKKKKKNNFIEGTFFKLLKVLNRKTKNTK